MIYYQQHPAFHGLFVLVCRAESRTEQPFTRDLTGVAIPAGVSGVVVEGRDQKSGWGGKTLDVVLPGR